LVHNGLGGESIPKPANPSEIEAARLKGIFKEVVLPEITGVDFSTMTPQEIAKLLPSYGGDHPIKAILLDKQTGKAYGAASGWDVDTMMHNGMPFQSGIISPEAAAEAGGSWQGLGNHVEPVAAAFMRKMGITDAEVYINGRNPCWGTPDGTGCYYKLTDFLAEGSKMTVYNKYGSNVIKSRPDRLFNFVGKPD